MTTGAGKFVTGSSIEIINTEIPRGTVKFAIFDFDGTISLIREGWQQIMIPMMVEILMETPDREPRSELEKVVRDFVSKTTGKQTIYQMIQLAEEVSRRGGTPLEPLDYKHMYHDLLMERITHRIEQLKSGKINPDNLSVPGSLDCLREITSRGVKCFLASGTDQVYVLEEAELLGVTGYFEGIYGALDDYQNFSKKMVIDRILRENNLMGTELIAFGDGYVEIENTKQAGGLAIGVATNEAERAGIDKWKRERLIESGADVIMPDFLEYEILMGFLEI
jgi:phosphoglycolate phosphatase-like HAD superfamily hydrolase